MTVRGRGHLCRATAVLLAAGLLSGVPAGRGEAAPTRTEVFKPAAFASSPPLTEIAARPGAALAVPRLGVDERGATPTDNGFTGIGRSAFRGYRLTANAQLDGTGGATTSKRLRAVAAAPDGRPIVAFQPAPGTVELAIVRRVTPASRALGVQKALVRVHARASAVSISWR